MVFAQNSKSQHLIGLNANTISGTGISYRYNYKKFTTQLTALGYKKTVKLSFNTGVSFLYTFKSNKTSDFLIGMSGKLKYLKDDRFVYTNDNLKLEKQIKQQINLGIHVDYFKHFSEKLKLNLSLGYGLYNLKGRVNELDYGFTIKVNNPYTFVTGGIALYYRI